MEPATRLEAAANFVRSRVGRELDVGLVLGTGLGDLAEQLEIDVTIDYRDIPGMPRTTVEAHAGRLVVGSLEGRSIAVLQGRLHLYEGHSPSDVVFPVRLLRRLGARALFVTFACGGLKSHLEAGDLVVLSDHLNLQGTSPLVGPNDDDVGPRFPDMSEPYDRALRLRALAVAAEHRIVLHPVVYAAVLGPQLETSAEIRMLRVLGADVVGMSTVPEVIAARHAGMRSLAVGVVTNECRPGAPVDVAEVLRVAAGAGAAVDAVLRGVLERV